jgi:predicted ATP-grasp superfamily ATP-dependent carboligase
MASIVSIKEWLDQDFENSEADERLFLTEEEVRSFPQFANASEEEVENIIDTLHDLALITYELFCKRQRLNSKIDQDKYASPTACYQVPLPSVMPQRQRGF